MAEEPRQIGILLMGGLVAVPIVIAWFLLRPGYADSTRVAAFTYAFALPVLTLLACMVIAGRLVGSIERH